MVKNNEQMEPKDLKNSEELKSTAQPDADKPDKTVDSKNEEAVDSLEKDSKEKKTKATKEKPPEKIETESSEIEEVTATEEVTLKKPETKKKKEEKPATKKEPASKTSSQKKSAKKEEVTAEKETILPEEQKVTQEKAKAKKKKEEKPVKKAESKSKASSEKEIKTEEEDNEKESVETEEVTTENKTALPEEEELTNEKPETKKKKKEKPVAESEVESESLSKTEEKSKEKDTEKKSADTKVADTEKAEKEKETQVAEVKKKEKIEATDQKKEHKSKSEKKETIDYSKYTQVELINEMRDVLDNPDDYVDLKSEIDTIKSVFYKKRNEKIEQDKKDFVKEGGIEEEFVAEDDPYENDIKELLKKYKQIRIELNKRLDQEKEENLKKKYEVIENIKGLINNEESINKTFNDFRDLQREWREIGLVPQSKMKNLWDLYHFHVENFYDYIKINRELRDLDLKKNLEIKINLCENAEELLVEPSIIKAFNMLQKYHEQWREIGPVPRENKDDIWERFKSVTAKINKKHQDFYENRKLEQKKNLEAKTALCEKVEEINSMEIENYKEWDERSRDLIELQKVWRTIGFAPKKDNNKIYDRFRTACDEFFNKKREFYSKNKELQQNNLQMKIDLCVQAEALKDSTDWKKTTQDLINIQRQWKEIGPVPRKHSDIVWKRFRAACDYFFEKKSEHFSDIDSEQLDNLKLKEDLIKEVANFKSKGNVDENLRTLKEFQRRWTEIGHVPFRKKDDLQNRFRDAINILYDELNIDEDRRNLLKFKSKMASFSESNRGQNKMRMEREKYMNKLKQLENDLVLLDNNIGFFAKSKNAESLIADVEKKIEVTKQKIETLKEKIRVIDDLDNQ